jgi:hypothetical protein
MNSIDEMMTSVEENMFDEVTEVYGNNETNDTISLKRKINSDSDTKKVRSNKSSKRKT